MESAGKEDVRETEHLIPQEVEPLVLASYRGSVFYPSGTRLSLLQQCRVHEILSEIYKGCYRRNVRCALCAEDTIVFQDPVLKGADTYGEMLPETFLDVLWKLGARPGDSFCDLGSGTGKLVALAWLAGLRARGIEISRARAELACQSLSQLESRVLTASELKASFPDVMPGALECICGNISEVDFSEADLVSFSSVMYTNDMVAKMASIVRRMKPGSRIISCHNLANLGIDGLFPEFRLIAEVHLATTWNSTSSWVINEVVASS